MVVNAKLASAITLAIAAVIGVPTWCCAFDGKPVGTTSAITLIANLDRKIETARWHIESKTGKFLDGANPQSIDSSNSSISGSVIFEPGPKRYRLEVDGVQRWIGGAEPFLSLRRICTFDGGMYRKWELSVPGTTSPDVSKQAGTGTMQKELGESQGCLEALAGPCGLQIFPPMFPTLESPIPVRLSDFLSRKVEDAARLQVSEQPDGDWVIETVDKEYDLRILYSPERSGLVLKAEWGGSNPANPGFRDEDIWLRVNVEPQPIGDFWVPRSADVCYTRDKPPQGSHLTFSSVVINEAVAPERYLIDFPSGTYLTDYVSGKAYTVSGGPVDDQTAVRTFMHAQGITPPPAPSERLPLIPIGLGVFTVVLIAVVVFRYRRRVPLSLLCAFIALPTSARCAERSATDPSLVSYSPREKIHVSQRLSRGALCA